MNITAKKVWNIALRAALGVASVLGLWALGFVYGSEHPAWKILAGVSGGLIFAVMLINVVLWRRFKSRLSKMDPQAVYDFALSKKDEAESDYQKMKHKLDGYIKFSYAYYFFLLAAVLFFVFCLGKITSVFTSPGAPDAVVVPILFAILAVFIVMGLLSVLLPFSAGVKSDKKNRLSETEYPGIVGCILQAAKKAGVDQKIYIYLATSTSIAQEADSVLLTVNPLEISLWTKEELYSVMLHEFAHFNNKDTGISSQYTRISRGWASQNVDPFTGAVAGVLLSFPYSVMSFHYEILLLFTSRVFETRADSFVKQENKEQDFINATAKSTMLDLFDNAYVTELRYSIYESEEPVKDYCENYLALYAAYLSRYEERWNFILTHALPPRIGTHPTFKQRMENLGCTVYDYTKTGGGEIKAEKEKLLQVFDGKLREAEAPAYASNRQVRYLERKEQIERYRQKTEQNETLSDNDKVDAADALLGIDNAEAIRLLTEVLAAAPDNARANHLLAVIYYYDFDERCVSFAYRAIEGNLAFVDSCMEMIGRYALNAGRQDILDEYRANVIAVVTKERIETKNRRITARDTFLPHDLSQEFLDGLTGFIVQKSGNQLTGLLCAKKQGTDTYVFGVEFDKRFLKDFQKSYNAYQEVISYLSGSGLKSYTLILLTVPRIKHKLKKTAHASVYQKETAG